VRLPALLVLLALAVPVSGGCGNDPGDADCLTNCNFQYANCGFAVTDCATQCSDTGSQAADAGCTSQNDAYSHCLAGHLACDSQACTAEQQNFYACVMPYCAANNGHAAICPPASP
jgi:hypothetical protein